MNTAAANVQIDIRIIFLVRRPHEASTQTFLMKIILGFRHYAGIFSNRYLEKIALKTLGGSTSHINMKKPNQKSA
jgi:hypothetical protein